MLLYSLKQKLKLLCLLTVVGIAGTEAAHAQRGEPLPPTIGDTLQAATLDQVVNYAITHQPLVKQAEADEAIANSVIKGKLADWLPQVNFALNYQRYFDLQSSVIGGNVVRFGVDNTSSAQITATQNVFNRDALLASTTASKVRVQAQQYTEKSKIDIVVNVTKAFYDLLATQQQISVNDESIVRLQRSLKDARSRYDAGIADKTDYKRAQIQLTNTKVSLQTAQELLKYKREYLKMLMGYPVDRDFNILYDTASMEKDVPLDTTQELTYTNNIDYRLLFMQKELQEANVKYANWAYLPSINLFGAYNNILNYQNNSVGELYQQRFPFSYAGATLAFPIFQGGKRMAKVREQKWTSRRIEWGLANMRSSINAEYNRALATYKSNLANFYAQKENVELARDVYNVIQLQYSSGIRPYLDVTVAETDLRTTRINYYNALYSVLASKMDVLRALGQIPINKPRNHPMNLYKANMTLNSKHINLIPRTMQSITLKNTSFLVLLSLVLAACGKTGPAGPSAPPAVSVSVLEVKEGNASFYAEYPAIVRALNEVELRPQVSGYITGIFFKEGERVKKGQKLYSIDPQQSEGAYQQALANLKVQETNLLKAKQDVDRYRKLNESDAIAKQQVDYAEAAYQAAEKQVDAAKAVVSSVQTNVRYTTIAAPFDGTIGISAVRLGTSVSPGTTLLNTISTDDPIGVDITIDQKEIYRFSELSQKATPGDSTFRLAFGSDMYLHPGHITVIDRAVDAQTGTLRVRFTFVNPEHRLRSGMSATIRLLSKADKAVLIPFKAVTEQLGEFFVYVADSSKVTQRKVALGQQIGREVVIQGGLKAGETIVVEGVQNLREGSAISVAQPAGKPAAGGSPAASN